MEFDVLSLRREASRSTRRPIWQRLNLDVVAAIMLAGYSYTAYLTHSDAYDINED